MQVFQQLRLVRRMLLRVVAVKEAVAVAVVVERANQLLQRQRQNKYCNNTRIFPKFEGVVPNCYFGSASLNYFMANYYFY